MTGNFEQCSYYEYCKDVPPRKRTCLFYLSYSDMCQYDTQQEKDIKEAVYKVDANSWGKSIPEIIGGILRRGGNDSD